MSTTGSIMRWCFCRMGLIALGLVVTGCAPTQQQLTERASRIALPQGLLPQVVATEQFKVMTYARLGDPGQPLRIYLEGDGRAWVTRTRISLNPTPHDPLALRLAAEDDAANVVYIARPCQYVNLAQEHHCNPHMWSQARYSEDIVRAIDAVIDRYAGRLATVPDIELVGYSGGGALAVLVALRRGDVTQLRTVAANLDTERFTGLHQVSALKDSHNPADYAERLQHLPQRHYVGGSDQVVPAAIALSYWQASGRHRCIEIRQLPGITHNKGWQELWPQLLTETLSCPTPAAVAGTVTPPLPAESRLEREH